LPAKTWSEIAAWADAYVIVTPEYSQRTYVGNGFVGAARIRGA
jgi:hypothetical protein